MDLAGGSRPVRGHSRAVDRPAQSLEAAGKQPRRYIPVHIATTFPCGWEASPTTNRHSHAPPTPARGEPCVESRIPSFQVYPRAPLYHHIPRQPRHGKTVSDLMAIHYVYTTSSSPLRLIEEEVDICLALYTSCREARQCCRAMQTRGVRQCRRARHMGMT